MTPKERIVNKALELYNENGIEYVGMRELAASLDLKLGNITYYFPTKEDLVNQIAIDLSEHNSKILYQADSISVRSFLDMYRKQFESQYRYRCLFLSFVHLIKQYEGLSKRYAGVEKKRKETVKSNIEGLVENKYLRKLKEEEMLFLISSISFVSRFWISEAAISHSKLKPASQMDHYISMMTNIILPYCTAKGLEDIGLNQ